MLINIDFTVRYRWRWYSLPSAPTTEQWNWGVRVKSNLQITLANGKTQSLKELFPPKDHVHLFPGIKVLGDVECHLGTANCRGVKKLWAVLTNTPD